MNWTETLRTSWSAVRSHSLRSLLTVLGILIGIAAVILTVGLGLGTQKDVSAQISSLGSNLLIVSPGSSTDSSGVRGGFGTGATLTTADAEALASPVNAPDIEAVAAEKSTSLSLEAGDANWTTTVTGTTPSWLDVRSRELLAGSSSTTRIRLRRHPSSCSVRRPRPSSSARRTRWVEQSPSTGGVCR